MSKRALKIGFQAREFRHVLSIPAPKGIKRQGDPGKLAPEQFWTLQNARITGSQVESRRGLTKATSLGALTGAIIGIFDDLNG